LDVGEADREDARVFEAGVFQEVFGVGRAVHDQDFGPWEPWTRFALVRDLSAAGALVAVVRLILPGPLGSQARWCATRAPWSVDDLVLGSGGVDWSSTWDVATIAVSPTRRAVATSGVDPAVVAWHAILRVAAVNSVTTMAAVLDERVRASMAGMGLVVHDLPGCRPRPYEGSAASTPVFRPVADLVAQQARERPAAYRQLVLGQGLAAVDLPGDADLTVARSIDVRPVDLTRGAPGVSDRPRPGPRRR
jgi:hypothetical protein